VLGVDVDDVAHADDHITVGARLRVGGRRSFGGHASHAEIVGEVAAAQRRAARRFIDSRLTLTGFPTTEGEGATASPLSVLMDRPTIALCCPTGDWRVSLSPEDQRTGLSSEVSANPIFRELRDATCLISRQYASRQAS
jgi:hypothetical protein